jgi:hypothetical protein
MKNLIIICLVGGLFFACKKEEIRKFVTLDNFTKIEINSSFEVILVQDTLNSLEVIGDLNFVKTVDYSINGETLFLQRTGKKSWTHPKSNKLKLIIHVKNLRYIKVNETSNISSENQLVGNEIGLVLTSKLNIVDLKLNCNTFYSWNNFPCSGTIQLSGNATIVKLWMVALIAVDAQNLSTQYAIVDSNTKGVIQLNTLNLSYSIKGQGNIEVFGQPILDNQGETGTGKLILK